MVHIRNVKLRGFKSFAHPTQVEFRPGLNAIVGGNGSGKSNIIDALRFVLGQLSSKTLRADNHADLIFRGKDKKASDDAVVYFELDNKEKVIPTDSSVVQVARRIRPDGTTQFKLNGKNASRQEVVDTLSYAKVSPEGHNIIMQGDVSRFVDMKPLERRQLVEEIAGISQYEERKLRALQELEKVDEKLKEASIVLKEKEGYLNGLYEEKKEAERYRSFTQELQGSKATKVRLEMEKVNHNKNLGDNELKKNQETIESLRKELTTNEKKVAEVNSEIEKVEKDIEKRGGEEQLNLQKDIERLRMQIESGKVVVESSERELGKIEQRKTQLTSDLKELTVKIKSAESNREDLDRKKKAIEAQTKSLKKSMSSDSETLKKMQIDIEAVDLKLEELATKKGETVDQLSKLDSQREILFYKVKDAERQLKELEGQQEQIKSLIKDKDNYRSLIAQINDLTSQDEKIAQELSELRKEKTRLDEEATGLKVSSNAVKELIKRDRAISVISKSGIKGIRGTVAELGKVSSKFSKALKVVAGGKMKNMVVDDEDVAIRCLNALKETKAGTATFLPLNKMRITPMPKLTKRPGIYGLASDLVSYDKKYSAVFNYIFGNTIVVEDINVAKSIGIGSYKMVTLDGDVFQTSGAITGGFISKDVGLGFQEEELQNQLDEVEKVRKKFIVQIDSLETKRADIEGKSLALRREKSELEGKIESVGKLDEVTLEVQQKLVKDLQNELENVEKQKKLLEKASEEVSKEISMLKSNKQKLNMKLKSVQFGDREEQVKKIEEQEHALTSQLATVLAQLENGLLPEQKNIERVIRELSKEEIEFRKQAEVRAKEVIIFEKELARREGEEKEAYGKLKQLFKDKVELREQLDKASKLISSSQQEISKLEEERNEIAVRKAKIESKLSGLQEELSQLDNVASLEYLKSINAAEKKIEELDQKIASMGNVNMKALEIYETLKGEYDKLNWKVQKLSDEKGEIHKIISEVEKKKKDSFMETFNQLRKNFLEIYSKMADKESVAELHLENAEDPFAGGLSVSVAQDHKHLNVSALSGGEKVIVALALIFAIQEFNPAPFYLLDEVDAALDDINSEKIAKLLKEYSAKAQIIMISHNDSLISAADYLYGVSMNKEGTSKIVSLEL